MYIVPGVLLVFVSFDPTICEHLRSEMLLKQLIKALYKTDANAEQKCTVQRIHCGRSVEPLGLLTGHCGEDMRSVHLTIAKKGKIRGCEEIFFVDEPKNDEEGSEMITSKSITVKDISFIVASSKHKDILYGFGKTLATFGRILTFNKSGDSFTLSQEIHLKEREEEDHKVKKKPTRHVYGVTTGMCPRQDNTNCIYAVLKSHVRCCDEPSLLQTQSEVVYTDFYMWFDASGVSALAMDWKGQLYMLKKEERIFVFRAAKKRMRSIITIKLNSKFSNMDIMKGGTNDNVFFVQGDRLFLLPYTALNAYTYQFEITIPKDRFRLEEIVKVSKDNVQCWMLNEKKIVSVSKTFPFKVHIVNLL